MKNLLNLSMFFMATMIVGCSTSSKYETSRSPQQETTVSSLQYEFVRAVCEDKPCLKVTLSFEGDGSGKTIIKLPSKGAGQKELERAILSLNPISTETKLQKISSSTYEIHFAPKSLVSIQYSMVQDFTGEIADHENYYRAVIQKDYFHLFGQVLFAHPEMNDLQPIHISLKWTGFQNQKIANSFGANQFKQEINTNLRKLLGGVYLGGDFRLKKMMVRGKPVWTSLRGSFGFKDAEFQSMMKKILEAERGFWNDDDFPYFLISAIPVSDEGDDYGGCGLTQGFSIFGSTQMKINDRMIHLLSHELFHTWNGRKIQREDPEELVYWFSEGFTNYYARLLSLRAGLMTLPIFLKDYNQVLKNYWMSPARNEPVSRVLKDFWNNRDVEKLPYQQGDILAQRWNAKIKEASNGAKSLDHFMKDFLTAAQTQGDVVSPSTVDRLMRPYLVEGVFQDHENFISKGKTIELYPQKIGNCIQLGMLQVYPFDLGFDFNASKLVKKVIGVKSGGLAERAGLKDNQVLTGWSVNSGDVEHEASFTILTENGKQKISFVPRGAVIEVPQYQLDEAKFKKDPKSCLDYFALDLGFNFL